MSSRSAVQIATGTVYCVSLYCRPSDLGCCCNFCDSFDVFQRLNFCLCLVAWQRRIAEEFCELDWAAVLGWVQWKIVGISFLLAAKLMRTCSVQSTTPILLPPSFISWCLMHSFHPFYVCVVESVFTKWRILMLYFTIFWKKHILVGPVWSIHKIWTRGHLWLGALLSLIYQPITDEPVSDVTPSRCKTADT